MSAKEILDEMRRMPSDKRRELVEQIREEFGGFGEELTLAQIAEFERRGEELRRNPKGGVPWEQVRAELKERLRYCFGVSRGAEPG